MAKDNTTKKIEQAFLGRSEGLTIQQIIDITKLARGTVKTYLDELIKIGRVHEEQYGQNTKVYFLNGIGKFQHPIKINKDKTIYVDVMTDPWKNPFIRIKFKTEDKNIGAVFLNNEESVDKLIKVLETAKPQLKKYKEMIAKLDKAR